LVRYSETARLAAGVARPRGIAAEDAQHLWVVGEGEARRLAVAASTAQTDERLRFEGAAQCVAADRQRLLIGVEGKVLELPRSGAPARTWLDAGPDAIITCIAIGPEDVYVADAGGRKVIRCDVRGNVRGFIGKKDVAHGYAGLIVPSPHLDVVIGDDGAVHVTNPGNHQIEVFDPDGSLRWSWGESSEEIDGFCGCCNPTDTARFSDGRYVTAEKGIPRVKIYTAEGHFESVVAGPEHLSPGVVGLDVAAMPDGSVAVLDPGIEAIRVFHRKPGAKA